MRSGSQLSPLPACLDLSWTETQWRHPVLNAGNSATSFPQAISLRCRSNTDREVRWVNWTQVGWLTYPCPGCKLTKLGSNSLYNPGKGLLCTKHCVSPRRLRHFPIPRNLQSIGVCLISWVSNPDFWHFLKCLNYSKICIVCIIYLGRSTDYLE